FARFAAKGAVEAEQGTVFLVCTAAGEVGVNMSADHLVCDLTTFDSMTQRFGRVNRFGDGDARIEVVFANAGGDQPVKAATPGQTEYLRRRQRSLELLRQLPSRPDGRHDASPAALDGLPLAERQAAFAPPPSILP